MVQHWVLSSEALKSNMHGRVDNDKVSEEFADYQSLTDDEIGWSEDIMHGQKLR